ncbi:hypothetical protein BDW66DRAFT_160611 [Aspergillus desertorum]
MRGALGHAWFLCPEQPGVLSKDYNESIVFYRCWPLTRFGIFQGRIYAPGRHEIPVDVPLGTLYCLPDTVDGVDGYSVSLASDLTCVAEIKIYSGLSPSWAQNTLDNEWPGKVQYSLSLSDTIVPFKSHIRPHMHLSPLAEGLQLECIGVEVVETHSFAPSTLYSLGHTDGIEQERVTRMAYIGSRCCSLPSALTDCAQDIRTPYFTIMHKVVFTIRLVNLDGHVSMIRTSLPFVIYMHADNAQLRNLPLYDRVIISPTYGKHEEDSVVTDDQSMGRLTRPSSTSWENSSMLCRTPSYTSIAEAPPTLAALYRHHIL